MFNKLLEAAPALFMALIGLVFIVMLTGLLSLFMGRWPAVALMGVILAGLAWYAYPRAAPDPNTPRPAHLPDRLAFYREVNWFYNTLFSGRYGSWEGVPIEKIIAQAKADLPHAQGDERAEILNILAAAYDHLDEYPQALEYARLALASFPSPEDKLHILNNLTIIYTHLGQADQAVAAGTEAWAWAEPARTDRLYNQASAVIAQNLGMAYVGQKETDQAVAYLTLALSYFKPYLAPYYCFEIALAVGELEYRRPSLALVEESKSSDLAVKAVKSKDLDSSSLLKNLGSVRAARAALELAHTALSHLHQQQIPIYLQARFPQERVNMYQLLVHTCLLELAEEEAFYYATISKGQRLVEALQGQLNLPAEFQAKYQQTGQLAQQIAQLHHKLDQPHDDDVRANLDRRNHRASLAQKSAELTTLLAELRQKYPGLMATQSAPELLAESAHQLAQDLNATLVEFYQHVSDEGSGGGYCAFVITPDLVRYVALPDVTDEFLADMVAWVGLIEQPSGQAESTLRGPATLWDLYDLYEVVIAPLRPFLPIGQRLILAPYGKLHLLPLQAACLDVATKRYLCDEYELAFVPSLSALSVAWQLHQKKEPKPSIDSSLAIINARMPDGSLLNFQQVTFMQKTIIDESATVQKIVHKIEQYGCIHFFCHAQFRPDDKDTSGLFLADGYLTANDVIGLDLSQVRLMTLAACRMGRAKVEVGDELTSLTNILLMAKAQAVVAGLWDVNVEATGSLFTHFYTLLEQGMPPTQALAEASRRIRADRAWWHPYYWAAFQVTGLGFEV